MYILYGYIHVHNTYKNMYMHAYHQISLFCFAGEARDEAVFLHGTNEMNTKDVLNYFTLYGPSYLEWIDDTSCKH